MNQINKSEIFRDRFFGRQDIYGRGWQSKKEDGSIVRGYAPVCDNFWTSGCHIKTKSGVSCGKCEIKKYTPVSDESVLKHIRGDEAQIQYVLLDDGTIKFGAIDFDLKPGKEHLGYNWEDVSKVLSLLKEWQIPHGTARSTGNGYHVYFFLDNFYPANKFRAFILEVFEKVGFLEEVRQGVRPMPEIFPKQSSGGMGGIGNGIKPPMIEPNFSKERNGFVTDKDIFIPADLQWEHLAKVPKIQGKSIDEIIERYQIPVLETQVTGNKSYSSLMTGRQSTRGNWEPPMTGSMEKVVEGCAAFRGLRDRCDQKEVLGHSEGFSLYHMSMHTADGIEWFKSNVPGWGENEKDLKQLEHSLEHNYAPWTCRKMQEMGVCAPNTKCFEKKPPIDIVEGQTVVRDDLPEDQWPDPSPIRYAFGKGDDFLHKLQREAVELKDEKDASAKQRKLKSLIKRVQVFDREQQEDFKDFLYAQKVERKGNLNKFFGDADRKKKEEFKETADTRSDTIICDDIIYRKMQPHGYGIVKSVKGNQEAVTRISSTDIWIKEVKFLQDDGKPIKTLYSGYAAFQGAEYPFEIGTDEWIDNTKFQSYFKSILGPGWNILKVNLDHVRHAVDAFSFKAGLERNFFHYTQGWYKDAFLMKSVIVDSEGVRPNTEHAVDLSTKQYAKKLDFKLISDSDFKTTMLHIKSDLMKAWPSAMSYTGLSHTFLPLFNKIFSVRVKPSLFFEGTTGAGKTALVSLMQSFWGEFDEVLSILKSSVRGMQEGTYQYKDCLLVIDDLKGLSQSQTNGVVETIQSAYDGVYGLKLKQNGDTRTPKNCRSILVWTGEESPTQEASTIARMILVETDRLDHRQTTEKFNRCQDMRDSYCGVTPRFLHWMMTQDKSTVKNDLKKIVATIKEKNGDVSNNSRIADNLALNLVVWKLFVGFMLHSGATESKEANAMIKEHEMNIECLRLSMLQRCKEEQHGFVFVDILRHLILTGEVSIRNLNGFEKDNKPTIGFVKVKDDNPNTLYIICTVAHEAVKQRSRNAGQQLRGTIASIGRQLSEIGFLLDTTKGRNQKQIRLDTGTLRCWVLDAAKAGIFQHRPHDVAKQPELPQPVKDADGLY